MITMNAHDVAAISAAADNNEGCRWVTIQLRNRDDDRLLELTVFLHEFPETFGPALAEAINSVVAAHAKVPS